MRADTRRRRLDVAVLAAVLWLAACASFIPIATPVRDLKILTGTWEGNVSAPPAMVFSSLTVRPDGSAEWRSASGSGAAILAPQSDGKVRIRASSGYSGAFSLHEGFEKRVLLFSEKDAGASGELQFVKDR